MCYLVKVYQTASPKRINLWYLISEESNCGIHYRKRKCGEKVEKAVSENCHSKLQSLMLVGMLLDVRVLIYFPVLSSSFTHNKWCKPFDVGFPNTIYFLEAVTKVHIMQLTVLIIHILLVQLYYANDGLFLLLQPMPYVVT